jgi:hypothetical protein
MSVQASALILAWITIAMLALALAGLLRQVRALSAQIAQAPARASALTGPRRPSSREPPCDGTGQPSCCSSPPTAASARSGCGTWKPSQSRTASSPTSPSSPARPTTSPPGASGCSRTRAPPSRRSASR